MTVTHLRWPRPVQTCCTAVEEQQPNRTRCRKSQEVFCWDHVCEVSSAFANRQQSSNSCSYEGYCQHTIQPLMCSSSGRVLLQGCRDPAMAPGVHAGPAEPTYALQQ